MSGSFKCPRCDGWTNRAEGPCAVCAPDALCFTMPDGSCVAESCDLHDPKPSAALLWTRQQVLGHVPSTDTYGYTCDERGCAICNAGSTEEAASWWDEAPAPDDEELAEAAVWWAGSGAAEWAEAE